MVSLVLLSYFEKQAKKSGQLQELLEESTKVLLREEELLNLDKSLEEETTILTMDVYDSECFLNQVKQKFEQQRLAQENINTLYKHSMEFFYQLQNYDWKSNLHCKLQLMQLQYQNDMRELSEEYEMEEQREKILDQRPIVQAAHTAERGVLDVQAKINQHKQAEAEYKAKFLNKLKDLRSECNDNIVYLVKGSKEIVDLKEELETLKRSHDNQIEELLNLKQELQAHITELPYSTTRNTRKEEKTLEKLEISPSLTTLEPFPEIGNVYNATTVCGEQKKPSFLQLFKEWETEQQLQLKEIIMTTPANMISDSPPITATILIDTLDHSNRIDESLTNISLNNPPRSILRRPYTTNEDESETMLIPKKRVRFAEPEVHESKFAFLSEATLNKIEDAYAAEEKQIDPVANFTFLTKKSAIPFYADTETIEIFSTTGGDENEIERADKFTKQKVKKPFLVKANKLLKKAKLMGSQKLVNKVSKPRKIAQDKCKPKIEIQECRIVKPAGTKLPTKLPVELSPELQARVSPKIENTTTNGLLAPKSDIKGFKSPPKPSKRKPPIMRDCDTFFHEFLQQRSDSSGNSQDYKTTKDAYNSLRESSETEKSKPKRKKTEKDFDSFFRETLKGLNESENGPANLTAPTITKESDDDFLQFDMRYDEGAEFFGGSVDDFFAGQTKSENNDDFLSFDFDGDEKRKTDDFL